MAGQPQPLRVYARSHAMVQDFERLEAGIKKFFGWKLVQKAPPKDPTNPEDKGEWAFDMTDEVVEVPNKPEYRKCCQEGSLRPADEATAKACGMPFEPIAAHDTEAPLHDEHEA